MVQKTRIEWCDYVLNPVKGICRYNCPYCYAIRMYKRFKWNPEILYDYSPFIGLKNIKAGSKIFVGSTHDIFGFWIPEDWIKEIISYTIDNPHLTFIFLTKNPKRYNDFDFPLNAWIGYSTTGNLYHEWLPQHDDNVKFVSLEPIHGKIDATVIGYRNKIWFDWIIAGVESGNRKDKPVFKREWLDSAINFADRIGIPIFIKDNTIKEVAKTSSYIPTRYRQQEFPNQTKKEEKEMT